MNTALMVASWVTGNPSVTVVPACLIAGTLLLVIAVQIGGDTLSGAAVRAPERPAGWDEHPDLLTAMVDEHRADKAAAVPVIAGPGLGEVPTEVIEVVRPAVPQETPAPSVVPSTPGWFERRTHQGRHHQQGDGR